MFRYRYNIDRIDVIIKRVRQKQHLFLYGIRANTTNLPTLNFKKCSPRIQPSPKNVPTSKQKYNVPTLNLKKCSPITKLSLKNVLTSKKIYYINIGLES
jgi:hypothetical protein